MRWVCYGYFVDLQLPITVRSSYLSRLCGSMTVLAVEWYPYVPNYSCYAGHETYGNAAVHRLLSTRSRARTATVARMKRVKLR